MSISISTIKQLLWVLLGVFLLTYIIALNKENHFVIADTKWLSNDFLFAISGGAFASQVIVLVCEVIKYRQLKFSTEAALFSNFGNLYGQFLIVRSNNWQDMKQTLNTYQENFIEQHLDDYLKEDVIVF